MDRVAVNPEIKKYHEDLIILRLFITTDTKSTERQYDGLEALTTNHGCLSFTLWTT